MCLDHIKYAIPETRSFITIYFGRISFLLFAFLVGEGYCHTSNLKKYYKRLIIFACISQIPFMLFRTLVGEWRMLNILCTLLLGLIAITVFDKLDKKYYISLPVVGLIIWLGNILRVDYGWFGVAGVFLLYLLRNKKFLRLFGVAVLNFVYYFDRLFSYDFKSSFISYLFTTLPAVILLAYNGKLGKKTKYIYYIFYPVHMIILYVISLLRI